MSDAADSPLPPLYQRWASEILQQPIPREPEATCDHCAMLPPEGAVAEPGRATFYDPRTKCCTYHPHLPNFLVGAVLSDEDPGAAEGRARLEQRIAAGVGVTPLAIAAPRDVSLIYAAAPSGFGHAFSMRCPYYLEEGGRCGVWRHRNAMCATWFCKHARAGVGSNFWRSVHRLLAALERSLAWWCVLELAPGRESLERLMPLHRGNAGADSISAADLDRTRDPVEWRARWGRWNGREAEFFRAAAALVAPLSFDEVAARVGPEAAVARLLLEEAFRELGSQEIPERLRTGPLQLIRLNGKKARVVGYSPLDPIDLPRRLLDLLGRFDGRATAEVLDGLAAEGIRLTPSLVRRLVDFGLLVPPNA